MVLDHSKMTQHVVHSSGKSGLGFRTRIGECSTSYDVLRLMREIAAVYCFDYFMIIPIPRDADRSLSSISIITNWPPEAIQRYDAMGLLDKSRVLRTLQRSVRPIEWRAGDIGGKAPTEHEAALVDLLGSYGVTYGASFSSQDASGERGAICFYGDRDALTEQELIELSFLANLLFEKISEFRKPQTEFEQLLSARERECLNWTAGGKTSSEIATILGLSEHTVNHYLSATCQKLGAANRAHAVAKAFRAGLLT